MNIVLKARWGGGAFFEKKSMRLLKHPWHFSLTLWRCLLFSGKERLYFLKRALPQQQRTMLSFLYFLLYKKKISGKSKTKMPANYSVWWQKGRTIPKDASILYFVWNWTAVSQKNKAEKKNILRFAHFSPNFWLPLVIIQKQSISEQNVVNILKVEKIDLQFLFCTKVCIF